VCCNFKLNRTHKVICVHDSISTESCASSHGDLPKVSVAHSSFSDKGTSLVKRGVSHCTTPSSTDLTEKVPGAIADKSCSN
jgi:hypothetical protein